MAPHDDVVALLLADATPPARVGEVLLAARRAHGWKRKQVAAMLRISTDDLRAYERGTTELPPAVCAQLAECYGEELAAQVPARVPFAIDKHRARDEPDAVLATYLDIVKRARRTKPGVPLSLRAADLAALSAALETDPEVIEQRIVDLLGCSRDEARALHRELLRHRVVLPVAGLAAGVVALSGAHAALASPKPHPAPAPVEASVNHRFPTTTDASTTTTTAARVPVKTTPTTAAPTPHPRHLAPPPVPAPPPSPAPKPTPKVTPPSIPVDNTPVGVLPGEHPTKGPQN